jgi:cell division protein FtsQ
MLGSRRVRLSLLGVAAAGLLLGGGWLWFRDSSLVAVQQVTVTGQTGPDAGAIRAALASAARGMTTLDVQTGQLYGAVLAFPVVKRLEVSTQFPHGMRIHVVEELPVAVVTEGGRTVGVAADGVLLHDLARLPSLPRIELAVPPGGPRLTEPAGVSALAAAKAAPRALLARISLISTSPQHGLVAQLRDGPEVYLGDTHHLAAKWKALLAVLADAGSAGAAYIDVTDPGRPAAGADAGAAGAGSATGEDLSGGGTTAGTPSSTAVGTLGSTVAAGG